MPNRNYWIGLRKYENNYRWLDGDAVGSWVSWSPGNNNKQCLSWRKKNNGNHQFQKKSCQHEYLYFICQWKYTAQGKLSSARYKANWIGKLGKFRGVYCFSCTEVFSVFSINHQHLNPIPRTFLWKGVVHQDQFKIMLELSVTGVLKARRVFMKLWWNAVSTLAKPSVLL